MRAPKNPPIAIAVINRDSRSNSKSSCPETPMPINPESELTKMNTAAVAAAVFTFAHFFSSNIGDKKIPPPTPIIPLKKPIPPPHA